MILIFFRPFDEERVFVEGGFIVHGKETSRDRRGHMGVMGIEPCSSHVMEDDGEASWLKKRRKLFFEAF